MNFDVSMLLSGTYHDMLLNGLWWSIQLLCISLVLALPLSVAVALARLAPWKILRWSASAYIEVMRNVPLLVQMMFWYFAAPEVLPEAFKEWLYGQNFEAISAITALVLYTAAYMAEDVRSGIRAVPMVQLEASRALGFSFLESMRLVILPQAFRITIPPLISQILDLWKGTSVATVVGVTELMYRMNQIESQTFRSAEVFLFGTVMYLTVSLLITLLSIVYQKIYPVQRA